MFLLFPHKKPLMRETGRKKSCVILQNLNSWMIKYKKKQFALGNLVKFVFRTILSSKNWTSAKLLSFFSSVYRCTRKKLRPEKRVWYLLMFPQKETLTSEAETKKSWAILQNFNSWMIKLSETQNLPNCRVPNVFFYFIIQELKFFKIAQLFCLSWEVFLREWEKIFNTFFEPKFLPSLLCIVVRWYTRELKRY